MICITCGKEYHWCSSCGWDYELHPQSENYCSWSCMTEDTGITKEQLIQQFEGDDDD